MNIAAFRQIVVSVSELATKLRSQCYRNYPVECTEYSVIVSCDADFKLHVDVVLAGTERVSDLYSIPTQVIRLYLDIVEQVAAFARGEQPYLPPQTISE